MAHAQSASEKKGKGTGQIVEELWALLKDYARQETVDPLKGLLRFVAYGAAGMLLVGLGGTLLTVAVLRLIQAETAPHWTGNWSWIPYVIALAVSGGGALLGLRLVKAKGKPA